MQCCMLPFSLCKQLDKVNCNFLWGTLLRKRSFILWTGIRSWNLNWKEVSELNVVFVATRPFWPNESGHFGWDPKNLGPSCCVISIKDQIWSLKENRLSRKVFIMQNLYVTGVKVGSFTMALPPAFGMTPGWAPHPFERFSLVLLIFLMIRSLSLSFRMLMVAGNLISSLSSSLLLSRTQSLQLLDP